MAAPKKKSASESILPQATACACADCSGGDGLKYCYDGNVITLTDFPQTGGPWIPVFYPNGQHDWVNAAGMELASQAAMQNAAPAPAEKPPEQDVM